MRIRSGSSFRQESQNLNLLLRLTLKLTLALKEQSNMDLMEGKHKEWILETVDLLRQRKARPDVVRISRMLERYHGVTLKETKTGLESLVDEGKVIKVHFKGSVSYRRTNKVTTEEPVDQTRSSNYNHSTSNRITQAIKMITQQTGDGVTFAELERWLISKNPDTRLVKLRLHTALLREIDAKNVTKLPDNCFVLTESLPKSENTKELKPKSMTAKQATRSKQPKGPAEPSTEADATSESSEKTVNKRSRPLSKRKKIKKTHGPDFENPLKVRISNKENNKSDVCQFCSSASKCSTEGIPEKLLTCKDCNAKVHPSCMDYSEKLAERALNSPWQCMDCKTCCVCDGEGNDGLIVFCDECDKGYHLSCHTPPLASNPKGTWVCFSCKEMSDDQEQESNKNTLKKEAVSDGEENSGRKGGKRKLSRQKSSQPEFKRRKSNSTSPDLTADTEGASCLLTPSASPRPSDTFDYEMKMSLFGKSLSITEDNTVYSDASKWSIDDVAEFFKKNGYDEQAQVFQDQEIDGPSLLLMRREDVLTALGLKLGPALKIYQKIVKLQNCSQSVSV